MIMMSKLSLHIELIIHDRVQSLSTLSLSVSLTLLALSISSKDTQASRTVLCVQALSKVLSVGVGGVAATTAIYPHYPAC